MKSATWFDVFLLFIGFRQRFLVEGNSMSPILKNGDKVFIKPTKSFQIGDIVLANHPYKNAKIIKRITEFSTGGKLFLSGDNPQESTDSQTFGKISEKDILGKVVCFLK